MAIGDQKPPSRCLVRSRIASRELVLPWISMGEDRDLALFIPTIQKVIRFDGRHRTGVPQDARR